LTLPPHGLSSGFDVLLVDDDKDIIYTLKRGLENHGCSVTAFDRPAEALEIDPGKYDVAVLDVRMPELSGFELARRLWKKNPELQVCFLSAFEIHPQESRMALPSLKSHCFLTKPMLAADLASHIASHFEADHDASSDGNTARAG
jgi:CheY-like chemotaxis protein